jgi:hypothetical protein
MPAKKKKAAPRKKKPARKKKVVLTRSHVEAGNCCVCGEKIVGDKRAEFKTSEELSAAGHPKVAVHPFWEYHHGELGSNSFGVTAAGTQRKSPSYCSRDWIKQQAA